MTPKQQPQSDLDILRSRLENIIDMRHPLVLLAQRIDWDAIAASFGKFFTEKGRPALPTPSAENKNDQCAPDMRLGGVAILGHTLKAKSVMW